MAQGYTYAYLADGTGVYIPERKLTNGSPLFRYEPLRGSAFTLAVFDYNGTCVGWASTSEPPPPATVWE